MVPPEGSGIVSGTGLVGINRRGEPVGALRSVGQIGNQFVCRLNSFSARGPGSVAVVQGRQRFNMNDIDVPRTIREVAQPGHIVPAVCDAGNVFLNRFGFFYFVRFLCFWIHRVSFQIPIIRNQPLSFPGEALGTAQSLSFTPSAASFLAYASRRFAALSAVSMAIWIALGPLAAAALISPNLCAASASALLKVAMSSAWAMDEFTKYLFTGLTGAIGYCA